MRREARIKAMQILYTIDFNQINIEQAINTVMEDNIDPYAVELVKKCVERLNEVDQIIESALKNYTLNRLNLVDKAIVRLAVSEMFGNEPREVIINEALEITKEFSDQGDHKAISFNNRLLDNINNQIKTIIYYL